MQININQIMSFRPCSAWTRERMLTVTGGRESVDTSELVGMEIPTEDLIWLTQEILKARGDCEEYLLTSAFAERVLNLYESEHPDDARPRNAILAYRLYAMGEIKDGNPASCSAMDAAWECSSDAAITAWCAAMASASVVASYAADYAAKAAAASAAAEAYATAAAAELTAQRKICAVFLGNME
jgi:hypothetical protein